MIHTTTRPDTPVRPSPLHLELPSSVGALQPLDVARQSILAPSGLDDDRIASVLGGVMGYNVDYADLYFQLSREESWSLEDGIVKDGSYSIEQGVGVRALSGEKTGFAYSDEILLPALTEASLAARAIARSGSNKSMQAWSSRSGHQLYLPFDPLEGFSDAAKVNLLEQIDKEAHRADPRVTQVMASLSGSHEVVLVMASDGSVAADVRPLVRLNVSVIVEQNGRREQGYCGTGGRYAFARFLENDRWKAQVHEAVRSAIVNLEAVAAPAGHERRARHRARLAERAQGRRTREGAADGGPHAERGCRLQGAARSGDEPEPANRRRGRTHHRSRQSWRA